MPARHLQDVWYEVRLEGQPDLEPGRRYKMIYWDRDKGARPQFEGACASLSPDAVRWTSYEHNPVFDVASDVNAACWDPLGQRHILHHKMWRVDGDVVSAQGVDFPVGNIRILFEPPAEGDPTAV